MPRYVDGNPGNRFKTLSQLNVGKYPLRTCRTMHECAACGQTISLGQRYYDGGYNRRVHEGCIVKAEEG